MKALHFGAGNIGRGFIGQILSESGYEVNFVDVNPTLVSLINRQTFYPVRLVSPLGDVRTHSVGPVHALNATDTAKILREFATADIISTSVGANILPNLASLLAQCIEARFQESQKPIDILLCENQVHAGTILRDEITPLLPGKVQPFFADQVGLVETVVGRMVPHPSKNALIDDPLLIITEPFAQLPCAKSMFRNIVPPIVGLRPVENFAAYEARKLFLHNGGHAALAYLGTTRHRFIHECVADPAILGVVQMAMQEASAALVAEYGFENEELSIYRDDLLHRFANAAIQDTVFRVANDPMRKLQRYERLIGAASLCMQHQIPPTALVQVIVAALRYSSPDDPTALKLQQQITLQGVAGFLTEHCGIPAKTPLHSIILKELA